jgi:hypothetical protein
VPIQCANCKGHDYWRSVGSAASSFKTPWGRTPPGWANLAAKCTPSTTGGSSWAPSICWKQLRKYHKLFYSILHLHTMCSVTCLFGAYNISTISVARANWRDMQCLPSGCMELSHVWCIYGEKLDLITVFIFFYGDIGTH